MSLNLFLLLEIPEYIRVFDHWCIQVGLRSRRFPFHVNNSIIIVPLIDLD
jgi:hypothetical protein